jgi:hypothetical protein
MTDPVSPTTTTAAAGRRPGTVEAAFWLYLIAPVVGLIVTIIGGLAINASTHNGAGTGVLVTGIVLNVVYLVVAIILAMFFRRSANWARIVLTVVAVISFLFGGLFTFIIAIIALILSWLPASNAWFRTAKGTTAPRTA